MHGIVFSQLIKFVRENHGFNTLQNILDDSGIGSKVYKVEESHPDEELEKIISSACKLLNVSRDEILEAFGEFITPGLLEIYNPFIKKEWDVLDLLENIETTIHKTVRIRNPEADPPELKVERSGEHTILINYYSRRKMIHFGIGIIKAMGVHYDTKLDIKKTSYSDKQVLEVIRQ